MKESGCALTCLSLIVALAFIWLSHVMTFESSGLMAGMEGTPKEGWDYWMQKKYWQDFWSFAMCLSFSLAGVLLPLVATVQTRRLIPERRTADRVLLVVSLLHNALSLALLVAWIRPLTILASLPFVFVCAGGFATLIFWLRVRHPCHGPQERLD